ncbi:MAG: DUF977 family protein [Minisyncoccia bacterium]
MTDDQIPPTDLPAEAPAEAGTSQTPVSDGLASAPVEPTQEPMAEAVPSEPAQPVSEATPEAVAAEPQSEPEAPEPESAPRTQGAASAASAPSVASGKTPEHDRELLKIARAKIQTTKQQNFEKILKLFDTKEKITNDDVEKALRCSDRSAARYLKELVKQGKIKRVGKTGAGVAYVKA